MSGLTKDDLLEILRLSKQEKLSQRAIARAMGCGRTTVQDFLLRKTHKRFWESLDKKPIVSGNFSPSQSIDSSYTANKKYIICAAQNNTYVHDNFLKSIKQFCHYNNAELLVSTFLYNKNGFQVDHNTLTTWYDKKIRNYINNSRIRLAKDLVFCGELNIIPTATNPTNGFQSYAGMNDIIIPHTKQDLVSVATDKLLPAKIIYSTGAITQRNYVQRSQGQKAEEFHKYGALVVEVDAEGFSHVRQVECVDESGEFYDLDKLYTKDGVKEHCTVEAINWGDVHAAKLDPLVADISWRAKDNLLDFLKPKFQFVHDIFDMEARNHHSRKQQSYRLMMRNKGNSSVEDEIELTCEVLNSFYRDYSKVVIVESNHDRALAKWLDEADYRLDDDNARYFLELQTARYKWFEKYTEDFPAFKYATSLTSFNFREPNFRFLSEDDSFLICNSINCGQHGHLGNNGARGSVHAYTSRNMKYNIGHVHSPAIKGNVFAAGVSGKLDMGYNKGGSAWAHAHIVTYKNGARTLIFIKNYRYRG